MQHIDGAFPQFVFQQKNQFSTIQLSPKLIITIPLVLLHKVFLFVIDLLCA